MNPRVMGMKEFIWQDSYLFGEPRVDQQHRELFDLANRLVESSSKADLIENHMYLYRHVRNHFQEEERFMKKNSYPDFTEHLEFHNQMLDELNKVSESINLDAWTHQDILMFMREWIDHIVKQDFEIKRFFAATREIYPQHG